MTDGPSSKIVICGGPLAGKTTMARELGEKTGLPVLSTDSLISKGWSRASDEAAEWLADPEPSIIEGTAAVRALRKLLAREDAGELQHLRSTRAFHLDRARAARTSRQENMAKAIRTIWKSLHRPMTKRGVRYE